VIVCVAETALEGVYVTEQLLMNVPALPSETSVQLAAGLKPPAPLVPNATEPAGSLLPPADSVSVTVAVHVESSATTTDVGEQFTAVEVDRSPTVTSNPSASELSECTSLSSV
jgi:hypothetical protein